MNKDIQFHVKSFHDSITKIAGEDLDEVKGSLYSARAFVDDLEFDNSTTQSVRERIRLAIMSVLKVADKLVCLDADYDDLIEMFEQEKEQMKNDSASDWISIPADCIHDLDGCDLQDHESKSDHLQGSREKI